MFGICQQRPDAPTPTGSKAPHGVAVAPSTKGSIITIITTHHHHQYYYYCFRIITIIFTAIIIIS